MLMRGEALASMVLAAAAGTTSVSVEGRIGGYPWTGDHAGGRGGSWTIVDSRMPGTGLEDLLSGTMFLGIDYTYADFRDGTYLGGFFSVARSGHCNVRQFL